MAPSTGHRLTTGACCPGLSSQESPRPKCPQPLEVVGVVVSLQVEIHTGSRPRTPRSFLPLAGHSTSFSFLPPPPPFGSIYSGATPAFAVSSLILLRPKSSQQQLLELAQRQHHHPHQPLGFCHWPLVVYSAIRLGNSSPPPVPNLLRLFAPRSVPRARHPNAR